MKTRRIVITGVSRGLGRSLAEGFVAAGHVVFGCARSAEAIEALRRQFPEPHSFDAVDVASEQDVQRWAESVLGTGSPDLIVNNAGLINRNAPLWEVPASEISAVLNVNVKGVINVIRCFLPAMISQGSGVVVNMSSGWGRSVASEVAPYCATKWAIEGLTRALAEELPAGLAAVPVNPGVIHTDMLASCFGSSASSYPSPEQWAERAVPMILGLGPEDNGRPETV
jgi:NAD(P)-dependent dehydrogenase (short-subunit alcohol dehydrogenase family)